MDSKSSGCSTCSCSSVRCHCTSPQLSVMPSADPPLPPNPYSLLGEDFLRGAFKSMESSSLPAAQSNHHDPYLLPPPSLVGFSTPPGTDEFFSTAPRSPCHTSVHRATVGFPTAFAGLDRDAIVACLIHHNVPVWCISQWEDHPRLYVLEGSPVFSGLVVNHYHTGNTLCQGPLSVAKDADTVLRAWAGNITQSPSKKRKRPQPPPPPPPLYKIYHC